MPVMRNNTYICNDGGVIARWNGKTALADDDGARELADIGCEENAKVYIVSK